MKTTLSNQILRDLIKMLEAKDLYQQAGQYRLQLDAKLGG